MIECKDLTFPKEKPLLENVNLSFEAEKIHVITGASGSGKTTLLHLINGIVPHINPMAIEGQVLFKGKDIGDVPVDYRSQWISTVFQNPKTQFYAIDSTDEMAFALENRNIPPDEIRERIYTMTDILHMTPLLNRNLFHLSGGEKQLVAIASVAIMEGDVVLFDEPSASLDGNHMALFRECLAYLKAQKKTVIIAEHRLHFLMDIADTLTVLENGQAYTYNQERFTADLVERHHLRCFSLPEDEHTPLLLTDSIQESAGFIQGAGFTCPYKDARMPEVFQLPKGINYLVGENGAGKTTFLNHLAGLVKKCGDLYLAGEKIENPTEHMAMVFQHAGTQLFAASVAEELAMVCQKAEEVEALMQDLRLEHRRDAHPQSLSGGEKQRLALGKALCLPREVLLLDEPTSGLCRSNMENLAQLLQTRGNRFETILIVTHDKELIHTLPGKIYTL